jgi:formylmethanofuran dehydrogenase subunit C
VTGIALTLKAAPRLRVDMRGITPMALAADDLATVARRTVWHGNEAVALAELFTLEASSSARDVPTLRFVGDLARFDRIGWAMVGGHIEIEGPCGDYLGALMSAGEIRCRGDAGLFAGCEMVGGHLRIAGNVGDFAAAAQPGSMDGMRGGELIVAGNAGERLGDRMRRGLLAVRGDAGDFAASRLVAGTIAIGGRLGAQPGFGMRRGTLVLASASPALPPTFVPTTHDITVFWHLLARQLHGVGGALADVGRRMPRRFVGDIGVEGKGEVLLLA